MAHTLSPPFTLPFSNESTSLYPRTLPADHGFNVAQLDALRLTSLILGAMSIASSMLTMYWFLGMTRSFRHDLIILLIQSDMLKALWFVVLPAVELASGPVASYSAICQASGFFLAVGIEACDVAVVLIAIHTALYIYCCSNGLYPHRHLAYTAFIFVPLILASMAFINKPAFTNMGQYCYLPRHPRWPRRALSWIPRYIILATICTSYVFTYWYVKVLICRFGEAGTSRGNGTTPAGSKREQSTRRKIHSGRGTSSLPPTPRISYHGLIPPTPPREAGSLEKKEGKMSSSTAARDSSSQGDGVGPTDEVPDVIVRKTLLAPVPENGIRWKIPQFNSNASFSAERPQQRALSDGNIPVGLMKKSRQEAVSEGSKSRMHSGASKVHLSVSTSGGPSSALRRPSTASFNRGRSPQPSTPRHFWNRSLAVEATPASNEETSESNIVAILRRGPGDSDSSGSVLLSPTALESAGMGKTRDKIRRQLRHLFIYPVVYIFVWLMPFVSHLVGEDASFTLVLASLISLCLQGIADAIVFSVLEKPWRHQRNGNEVASNWHTRLCRSGRATREGIGPSATAKVGKTREEMLVDSRMARRRRERELAERRLMRLAPARQQRDWWDINLESVDESAEDTSADRATV